MTTYEYKPAKEELKFEEYYEKLIWETIFARAHLKLNERLEKYKADYLKELNQAPYFFNFTMRSHRDNALLTLSRILDKHEDSLSIWKFLNFIEQNREIFCTEAFHRRNYHKPNYGEHWIKSHAPITNKEIEEDREKLGSLEDTITQIKELRDKVLAHNDRGLIRKGGTSTKKYDFPREKLYGVIDTLVKILNRYSVSYDSSTFLEKFPNEGDVQYIMDCIRFHIQERKKQLEALKKQTHNKG